MATLLTPPMSYKQIYPDEVRILEYGAYFRLLNGEKFKSLLAILSTIFLSIGIVIYVLYDTYYPAIILLLLSIGISYYAALEKVAQSVYIQLTYYKDSIVTSVEELLESKYIYFIKIGSKVLRLDRVEEDIIIRTKARLVYLPRAISELYLQGYIYSLEVPPGVIAIKILSGLDPTLEIIMLRRILYAEAELLGYTSDLVKIYVKFLVTFNIDAEKADNYIQSALAYFRFKSMEEIADEMNQRLVKRISRDIDAYVSESTVSISFKLYEIVMSREEIVEKLNNKLSSIFPGEAKVIGFEIVDELTRILMRIESVRAASAVLAKAVGAELDERLESQSKLLAVFKPFSEGLIKIQPVVLSESEEVARSIEKMKEMKIEV